MMAEQRAQGVVARLRQHGRHGLGELLRDLAQRGEQQRFLAAEMEIDRRGRVPRHAGDLGRREVGQAVARDRGDGRLDQVEPGAGGTQFGAFRGWPTWGRF